MSRATSRADERGASAVEYGLLIMGIAALVIGAIVLFGGGVDGLFNNSCDALNQQIRASDC